MPQFLYRFYDTIQFESHTLFERSLLQVLIILELSIVLYVILHTLKSIRLLVKEKILIHRTFSFESSPKNATHHFVLYGDSTAFGTGVTDQHTSIAGRLAKDYPHAHIDNKAENGAETKDVLKKMQEESGLQFFDLAIVLIGGNDIIFLRSLKKIERDMRSILEKTQEMTGGKTVLVSPMNVGSSLLFWFPLNILYNKRSKDVRKIFLMLCKELRVHLVDLYASKKSDFFTRNPELYFAPDKIHYSREGYGHIYKKIREVIVGERLVK